MTIRILALALAAATGLSPALAQSKGDKTVTQSNADRLKDEAEAAYANAPVEEQEVRHRDAVAIGGRRYPYTASAGTLTVRDVEGKPTASMFYTAYTLDGAKLPMRSQKEGEPGPPL